MLHVFTGDREQAREALGKAIAKAGAIVRVSDANSSADVRAALRARGMFDALSGGRTVVLDCVCASEESRAVLLGSLPDLAASKDMFYLIEEKPDAALRAKLAKYAAEVKKFEPRARVKEPDNFFALANALQRGQKKELWVLLQREYAAGKAPEMMHGALFWAAKQLVLKPRAASDAARGRTLVAALAALPHEARRRGEELDYALERFVLAGM